MTGQRWNQRVQTVGMQVFHRARHLLHEGNTRRVVIKREGQRICAFPLTIGLAVGALGMVRAPRLTIIGLLAAMLTGFTLQIERVTPPLGDGTGPYTDRS